MTNLVNALLPRVTLIVVSAVALAAFAWPFVTESALAFALLPVLLIIVALALDRSLYSGTIVAMLGVLTAVATTLRLMSTGFGGFELVFTIVILSGAAYGARFGFLLGVTTIFTSSLIWGGIGPWSAFQAFALGWVGAGAGLLMRRARHRKLVRNSRLVPLHVVALAAYGAVASYAFGVLMNLWFWPIATGPETAISFVDGAPFVENAQRFIGYTLVTSTLTWDTVRAVTTVVGILATGATVLRALGRAPISKPVVNPTVAIATKPRSTSPQGDETRTRRSTVRDATATLPKAPRRSAQV